MDHLGTGFFDFWWKVDSEYILEPNTGKASRLLLGEEGHIARRGGNLRTYKPAEECGGLHREFARTVIDTPSAFQFVQKWGFLGTAFRGPDSEEEQVKYILDAANRMRTLLARIDLGRKTTDWAVRQSKKQGIPFKDKPQLLVTLFNDTVTVEATVRLVIDEKDRTSVIPQAVPRSLLSWMYLRVLEEISEDIEWRRCANPNCKNPIYYVHLRHLGEKKRRTCGRETCRVAAWRKQGSKRKDN